MRGSITTRNKHERNRVDKWERHISGKLISRIDLIRCTCKRTPLQMMMHHKWLWSVLTASNSRIEWLTCQLVWNATYHNARIEEIAGEERKTSNNTQHYAERHTTFMSLSRNFHRTQSGKFIGEKVAEQTGEKQYQGQYICLTSSNMTLFKSWSSSMFPKTFYKQRN